MKRIGILSDTHSCWDERYAVHFKDCDEIWHAGDIGDMGIVRRLQEIAPVVRSRIGEYRRRGSAPGVQGGRGV